jgi:hypothetical protein
MATNQGLRQLSFRAIGGTAGTYTGDIHAACDAMGISRGTLNGRLLQFIQTYYPDAPSEINGALYYFASQQGRNDWNSLGSFDPLPVALDSNNLIAWYDAANSASLTLDSSNITQINDRSTNANHASNTGSNRPTLLTGANGRNGLPVMDFARASSQYLDIAADSSFDSQLISCYIVAKMDDVSTNQYLLRAGYNAGASSLANLMWGYQGTAANILAHARDASGSFKPSSKANTTDWQYYSMVWDASDEVTLYVDGEGQTEATGADANPSSHLRTRIGANSNTTADTFLDGKIAEIIIYGSAHNTATRQAIEGYLAQKWGF